MKNIFLKIIVLICVVAIICSFFSCAIASTRSIDSAITDIGNNSNGDDGGGMNAIKRIVGAVLDVIRLLGATVAIVMLLTVAVKYIVASAGDRADIKKYAFNYVVGALIFFGASAILTIIRNVIMSESGE